MEDGFVDYTLGGDYGEHKAGAVIRVDPERRDWLNANGFSIPTVVAEQPERARLRRRPTAVVETPPADSSPDHGLITDEG